MDPVATPYDIAAIPPSSFVPNPLAWSLVLVIVVFCAVLLVIIKRRERSRQLATPLKRFRSELNAARARLTAQNLREISAQAVSQYQFMVTDAGATSTLGHHAPRANQLIQELDSMRFCADPNISLIGGLLKQLSDLVSEQDSQ